MSHETVAQLGTFQAQLRKMRIVSPIDGTVTVRSVDPGETVATQFGIIGPPDTFFIDRGGIVVGRQIGQLSASDLQRGLSKILGE